MFCVLTNKRLYPEGERAHYFPQYKNEDERHDPPYGTGAVMFHMLVVPVHGEDVGNTTKETTQENEHSKCGNETKKVTDM